MQSISQILKNMVHLVQGMKVIFALQISQKFKTKNWDFVGNY